jgi:hypothetical protein
VLYTIRVNTSIIVVIIKDTGIKTPCQRQVQDLKPHLASTNGLESKDLGTQVLQSLLEVAQVL